MVTEEGQRLDEESRGGGREGMMTRENLIGKKRDGNYPFPIREIQT